MNDQVACEVLGISAAQTVGDAEQLKTRHNAGTLQRAPEDLVLSLQFLHGLGGTRAILAAGPL